MNKRVCVRLPRVIVVAAIASSVVAAQETPLAETAFEQTIAPLLQEHCFQCHGADAQEGGLRLDHFEGLAAGGESGPAVVPNSVNESLLVSAVEYKDETLQMPPDGKLADSDIAALRVWINAGASHPAGELTPRKIEPPFDLEKARSFWAFQPVRRPDVPVVKQADSGQSPIDAFILAQLEQHNISPSSPASKAELIRRVTFDLTGLPPPPEEIMAFVNDNSPDAYERVVDRLLGSLHYGERWGRHWLDVVRYADSNGLDENIAHGNAWRYRDYVIASFNADKPFNQFLGEQIAGDMLVGEDTSEERCNELLTATGFLSLGPKVLAEGDELKMQMDIVDEQIDTIGKAFLGLTFGCARCHDHKFDPISQADYTAMVGIFKSTRTMESLKRLAKWNENSIATRDDQSRLDGHLQQIAARKADIERHDGSVSSTEQLAALKEELKELEASVPELPTAMGVTDGNVASARINVRGSHLTLGRRVPRGIPVVFHESSELRIASEESGRRQLADWLTDPSHPLTTRVIVNRIWRWHFGRGLVSTTENFGHLGTPPTHPQLLDWLAAELVEQGWSLKKLHRTILLSSTYRQSSGDRESAAAADPENRLLWRFNPRRLEAEEIRDSILFVSGLLDVTPGGTILNVGNREFIFNHTSKDNTSYDTLRRSVYLPVIRNNLYDGFALFDYTDASVSNGNRATSTVAPQALYMMNSRLLLHASSTLAEQMLHRCSDDNERVRQLYRLALGRTATADESKSMLAMASEISAKFADDDDRQRFVWTVICQTVLASNEFVYVK